MISYYCGGIAMPLRDVVSIVWTYDVVVVSFDH